MTVEEELSTRVDASEYAIMDLLQLLHTHFKFEGDDEMSGLIKEITDTHWRKVKEVLYKSS